MSVEPLAAPRVAGLAERLDAAVRVEFRVDVLVPAVGDPDPGLAGMRGTRLRALRSFRRAVPGASGPVAKGWSSGSAGVDGDGGSCGGRSSAAAIVPGVRVLVRSAPVWLVQQAFPRVGQGRPPGGG
jgi:hypothetical protein